MKYVLMVFGSADATLQFGEWSTCNKFRKMLHNLNTQYGVIMMMRIMETINF